MSKYTKIFMALALAVVIASPALAEVKLNGLYRVQGTMQDLTGAENSSTFIDQRIRLMLTNKLNDNISVVYFGEVDAPFGELSKGTTVNVADTGAAINRSVVVGGGGRVGADGVNVETKHMYADFKVPDSTFAVRVGIQGWGTGDGYEDLVVADDMSAIKVTGKMGLADLDLIWSRWNNGVRDATDEDDFMGAKVGAKVSEQLSVGAIALYRNNDSAGAPDAITSSYFGVNGDFRVGSIGLKGFFLYGSQDNKTSAALDGSSWVVDFAARSVIPNGAVKVHFAYIPEADAGERQAAIFDSTGGFEYHNDNLSIFLTDIYYNNGSQGALALNSAYAGDGLWFATVSGDLKLPAAAYGKFGAGYFSAIEDGPGGNTDIGFELSAMAGKKFAEKYDLSLRGSYGSVGDYFAAGTEDLYKVVAMLNIGF